MKRKTKIRKQSKESVAKLQRKLWVYCRLLVRKMYGNQCYTCGAKELEGSNWQTGHMIYKATLPAELKYDLRLLRPQCIVCNVHRGGEGAIFKRNMMIRDGQEYVNKIFEDFDRYRAIKKSGNLQKSSLMEIYEMQFQKYKIMLEDLGIEIQNAA